MGLFNFAQKKPASDETLLSKYKEGKNTKYIGELYQRYTHLTFAVCMKYLKNEDDAKDAVMQLFERLMDDALKYDIDFFKKIFFSSFSEKAFQRIWLNSGTLLKYSLTASIIFGFKV